MPQETKQNFDENILRQITQKPVTYHQVARRYFAYGIPLC